MWSGAPEPGKDRCRWNGFGRSISVEPHRGFEAKLGLSFIDRFLVGYLGPTTDRLRFLNGRVTQRFEERVASLVSIGSSLSIYRVWDWQDWIMASAVWMVRLPPFVAVAGCSWGSTGCGIFRDSFLANTLREDFSCAIGQVHVSAVGDLRDEVWWRNPAGEHGQDFFQRRPEHFLDCTSIVITGLYLGYNGFVEIISSVTQPKGRTIRMQSEFQSAEVYQGRRRHTSNCREV